MKTESENETNINEEEKNNNQETENTLEENKTDNEESNKSNVSTKKKDKKAKKDNKKVENLKQESKTNKEKQNKINEEENKKTEKDNSKKEGSLRKKVSKKKAIISIFITILLSAIVCGYIFLRPKFKDAEIELGIEKIDIDTFLVSSIYKNNALAITDLSQIDLSKTGENEIALSYYGKEQKVILKVQDTTPPQVIFQDLVKTIGYEINPEDFIVEKNDLSEMHVELIDTPEINEYKDYMVKISVKDIYGNETIGECKLTITWLKQEVTLEVGDSFSIEDLVLDVEKFGNTVEKSEIDKVNTSTIGEYTITALYEGNEYVSRIKVQDTKPPELELQDISIYNDEKINDYKKFIKKVSDASGEPTTKLKTEIDYSIIGTQNIVIEATDINGNVAEKTAVLTIKKDTVGPVISGLKDLSVAKKSNINYTSGVSAVDGKDGKCEFKVDSSSVNTSVAGTYYATYTSKDKSGNTTTKKRKIIVNHDQADTNAKFDQFYNSNLAGKDIVGMAGTIKSQIKYNSNWGGSDPVWYGLTEGKGNCYVHTMIMQKALNKAGYKNQVIYRLDKGHYWNLVYVDGHWRHIDSTPSRRHTLGLLTDEQKWNDAGLDGVGWDKTKWPAAE